MTHPELLQRVLDEIHTSNGVISIIYKDFDTNTVPFKFAPDYVMQAGDMATIPILLAALMRVDEGKFSLDNCVLVPELWVSQDSSAFERGSMSYSIDELLSWMIIDYEPTAANTLIKYLGFNYINGCCEKFGMNSTSLESYLGQTKIESNKYNNITCAQDMLTFFEKIYRNQGLSRWLCEYAGRLLMRQRDKSGFMRYICDDIYVAHKSGEFPAASHEAGIFYLRYVDYFLAIFIANTDDSPEHLLADKRLRGRISNFIYNYYLEREDSMRNLPYPKGAGRKR